MNRKFEIGDTILCTESGVIGKAFKHGYDEAVMGSDTSVYTTTGVNSNLLNSGSRNMDIVKQSTNLCQHKLLRELLNAKKIYFQMGRR